MHTFEHEVRARSRRRKLLAMLRAKRGFVELFEPALGRTCGNSSGASQRTLFVVTLEPGAEQDVVNGAAGITAELVVALALDPRSRHGQPAMRTRNDQSEVL